MSHRIDSEMAALSAQLADLKFQLARARADGGHYKARCLVLSERMYGHDRRGAQALACTERDRCDDTGFAPGAWI